MLVDITGKLNRYFSAFKKINMEAILQDMDTRITNASAGILDAGSVSLTELSTGVQASLSLADSSLQTIANGSVALTMLASGVQTSLGKADTALQSIANGAVSLAKLATGVTPSHVVKFAGKVTWTGSGASLASTVTGVLSTDVVIACIQGAPTEAGYLVSAAPTTDTVTFALSAANTSNDAVISYQVIRAAA